LLTGTTPLDREASRQSALDEVLRRIREEEPTRPSTRLSGTGERLPSVAAVRSTEPARLARLVRGDLDRVVMKALEKDRARRYETADGLARDVQRYLDGSPVEAGPPSAWYRFGTFARRNRLALTAAAFAALALLAGTAVSTWQAVLARRARAESLAQRDEARRQEERARRAVDDMYTRVSQRWLAGDPGDNELRVEFLGKAAAYYEEFARAAGAGPGVRMERAHAWLRVGSSGASPRPRPLTVGPTSFSRGWTASGAQIASSAATAAPMPRSGSATSSSSPADAARPKASIAAPSRWAGPRSPSTRGTSRGGSTWPTPCTARATCSPTPRCIARPRRPTGRSSPT
jgi:hypothetical protein